MKKSVKLKRIQNAIDFALTNPRVMAKLERLDFPKSTMLEGKALFDQVSELDVLQQKEYGDQYQATVELNQARQEARLLYMKHMEMARIGFRNHRGFWKTLDLGGNRKGDLFGWLAQAKTFYSHIPQIKDVMEKYDVPETSLKQGQAMIAAVNDAYNVRQQEGSEALTATRQRDQTMERLDIWMRKFRYTARLAFLEDPEMLKALGLKSKMVM